MERCPICGKKTKREGFYRVGGTHWTRCAECGFNVRPKQKIKWR